MKKTKLLILISLVLVLVGCGKKSSDNPLYGEWEVMHPLASLMTFSFTDDAYQTINGDTVETGHLTVHKGDAAAKISGISESKAREEMNYYDGEYIYAEIPNARKEHYITGFIEDDTGVMVYDGEFMLRFTRISDKPPKIEITEEEVTNSGPEQYLSNVFMRDERQIWFSCVDMKHDVNTERKSGDLDMMVQKVFVTEKGNITAYAVDPKMQERDIPLKLEGFPKYTLKDFADLSDDEKIKKAKEIDYEIQKQTIELAKGQSRYEGKLASETPVEEPTVPVKFACVCKEDKIEYYSLAYNTVVCSEVESKRASFKVLDITTQGEKLYASEPYSYEENGKIITGVVKWTGMNYLLKFADEPEEFISDTECPGVSETPDRMKIIPYSDRDVYADSKIASGDSLMEGICGSGGSSGWPCLYNDW